MSLGWTVSSDASRWPRRADDIERIEADILALGVVHRHGKGQDGGVELARFEPGKKQRRLLLAQKQLQLGRRLAQLRQHARQKKRADGRDDADPQRTGQRIVRGDRDIDQVLGLPQNRPRPLGDLEAYAGRRNRAARTVEQDDAESLLEFLDRRAQRRLADEARLRRMTEMTALGERDQELELAERGHDFHPDIVNRFYRS